MVSIKECCPTSKSAFSTIAVQIRITVDMRGSTQLNTLHETKPSDEPSSEPAVDYSGRLEWEVVAILISPYLTCRESANRGKQSKHPLQAEII
jgi:hypothetical protein